jgi:hypothetical protein
MISIQDVWNCIMILVWHFNMCSTFCYTDLIVCVLLFVLLCSCLCIVLLWLVSYLAVLWWVWDLWNVYICMYVHTYVCMYVRMYYVRKYVCMYVLWAIWILSCNVSERYLQHSVMEWNNTTSPTSSTVIMFFI